MPQEVAITGIDYNDKSEFKELIHIDVKELDLASHYLQSLDLSPLQHCTKLRSLDLSDNYLEDINLWPLSYCTDLRNLDLSNNEFHEDQVEIDLEPLQRCPKLECLNLSRGILYWIELEPLQRCHKLQYLNLSENQFAEIDLAPLQHCTKLRRFDLSDGSLFESVDLKPLEKCKELRVLNLSQNRLSTVDLAPLQHCAKLRGLMLQQNKLCILDITPLLPLKSLGKSHDGILGIDNEVGLLALVAKRSKKLSAALSTEPIQWVSQAELGHYLSDPDSLKAEETTIMIEEIDCPETISSSSPDFQIDIVVQNAGKRDEIVKLWYQAGWPGGGSGEYPPHRVAGKQIYLDRILLSTPSKDGNYHLMVKLLVLDDTGIVKRSQRLMLDASVKTRKLKKALNWTKNLGKFLLKLKV